MRDLYLILNTVIAISLLVLSSVTLASNRKSIINRLFFVFTFCVGVWVVSACVSNDIRNSNIVSLYGNYLVFLFSYFSSYLLLWFSVLLVDSARIKTFIEKINLPILIVGFLSATPLVVAGVEKQGNVYAVIFGPLALLYGLMLVFQLVGAVRILYIGTKNASSRKKAQLKSILRSLYIAIPILVVTQFVAPAVTGSFEVTDVGILIMVLPVIGLYLSVIKHGLFDIKRAIIRSTAYALSLITLSAIYYVIAYFLSMFLFKDNVSTSISVSPVNIALALLLAFVFQPIKRFFDKATNRFFFKDNYSSAEFFASINKTLGSTIDLRGMLERVSDEIAKTLKGDQAFFFINIDDEHFITAGTTGHKLFPKADAKLLEGVDTVMRDGVIISSMLEDKDEIRRMMISHRVELIMPLKKDKNIIGYLCLGDHLTSSYKNKDINALNAISNGLIIAIQNALAVQEIREFNVTLKQRIANATEELRASNRMLRQLDKAKDEFVGMASHQLRTPLTSIKGYLSMVLDGDAGKITESQEQLLNEAFNSSERMVNLINDFLNVSRIQTGKFMIEKTEFNLGDLIEDEINNLKPSIEAHNLKYNFIKPVEPIIIKADKSKISQVAMNFMDNAIYYSPDKTEVKIDIEIDNKDIRFTVKDSGIGVPLKERSQLFTKFYRASNARKKRPDGNGVGLYLAKKIIDAHKGRIIFESIEGKGSTFGFSLPIS